MFMLSFPSCECLAKLRSICQRVSEHVLFIITESRPLRARHVKDVHLMVYTHKKMEANKKLGKLLAIAHGIARMLCVWYVLSASVIFLFGKNVNVSTPHERRRLQFEAENAFYIP